MLCVAAGGVDRGVESSYELQSVMESQAIRLSKTDIDIRAAGIGRAARRNCDEGVCHILQPHWVANEEARDLNVLGF